MYFEPFIDNKTQANNISLQRQPHSCQDALLSVLVLFIFGLLSFYDPLSLASCLYVRLVLLCPDSSSILENMDQTLIFILSSYSQKENK